MMYVGLLMGFLHVLLVTLWVSGVVLLLGWAIKHASAKNLKMWGIWFLIAAFVLSILSALLMSFYMSKTAGYGMRGGMMNGNSMMDGTVPPLQ